MFGEADIQNYLRTGKISDKEALVESADLQRITAETPQEFEEKLRVVVKEAGAPFAFPGSPHELTRWLIANTRGVYFVLMSPEFNNRSFFDQRKAAVGFSDFIREKDAEQAETYWRYLCLEIWLREFVDEAVDASETAEEEAPEKLDTEPNQGKNLDIDVAGTIYRRYPLRTKSITRGDSLEEYAAERLNEFVQNTQDMPDPWWNKKWQTVISEKIVAITQTRSFFVWEIEPGWWARKLSARITPSSYGYGLSIPWTMELAIREVGLPRILLASVGSVLGKLVGKAGVFYMIAGAGVRAIDGPLESPVYPSFLSAKLAPANTNKSAAAISESIRKSLPAEVLKNFAGTVIIDANDVGRHVLGKDVTTEDATLEAIFEDNPLGQGGERTPISVVHAL